MRDSVVTYTPDFSHLFVIDQSDETIISSIVTDQQGNKLRELNVSKSTPDTIYLYCINDAVVFKVDNNLNSCRSPSPSYGTLFNPLFPGIYKQR